MVNKVIKDLFRKYFILNDFMYVDVDDVMDIIKIIGLYKIKFKNIIGFVKRLVEDYDGFVLSERKDLELLLGVGRKIVNVVLFNVFGILVLVVDMYILRIFKRLGFVDEIDDVFEVEMKLNK